MLNTLTTVRRVLKEAPCSTRALARAAGLSHPNLSRILSGKRGLTAATAEALATGLEEWADTCSRLAKEMRQVAKALERRQEG